MFLGQSWPGACVLMCVYLQECVCVCVCADRHGCTGMCAHRYPSMAHRCIHGHVSVQMCASACPQIHLMSQVSSASAGGGPGCRGGPYCKQGLGTRLRWALSGGDLAAALSGREPRLRDFRPRGWGCGGCRGSDITT